MVELEKTHTALCCSKIYRVSLFNNVTNSKKLRELIFMGSLDCALIRPSLVTGQSQLFCAAESAFLKELNQTMKTKNINTEIIFNLHPEHQISEALKSISITDQSKSVLAVTLDDEDGSKMKSVRQSVEGSVVPFEEIRMLVDPKAVKALYKMTDDEIINPNSVCSYIGVSQLSQRS